MRIGGRLVLVTGAGSGIGAATAKLFAKAGARVLLLARTLEALESVAGEITTAGGSAHVHPVDLANADAVGEVARAILGEHGAPDVLVNNAGAGRFLSVVETSPEEAVAMMGAPYFAAFFVTRAFLPGMLRRGSGVIVNVNSPVSRLVWPGATGYAAARWALRGFTLGLRAELRGSGLHVAHVVPGKVSSGYFEHNPGSEERIPALARLVRTLSPEEVAAAILGAVEREKREVVLPSMLRLFYASEWVAPRVVERLLGTGWKKS